MLPWEVAALGHFLSQNRTVTIGLTDLAKLLNDVMPELQGAPVEEMIVDGIRKHAQGPESPRRFWARRLVELGRHGRGMASHDLLEEVNWRKIQLGPLQASLVLRRLALDLLVLAGTGPTTSRAVLPQWFAVTPAYADNHSPCTLDSTERAIMDIAALAGKFALGGLQVGDYGFEGLLRYLERNGVSGAKAFRIGNQYASIVLSYAKFIWTYYALTLEVSMDNPPLTRTKRQRPASGERRDLTAAVRSDIGNAQLFNCFRIALNAAGLDFSLPNDGPVKNARVGWVGVEGFNEAVAALDGGPEQIVRFVDDPKNRIQEGGDPSTGLNAVTNRSTNDNGMVSIAVEGVGQNRELRANAREVRKRASVRVDVAVKTADVFKDLSDAAKTASSGAQLFTLPTELLYRMKWASGGQYTFEVLDWREAGGWQGSINYEQVSERVGAGPTSRSGAGDQTTKFSETMRAEVRLMDVGMAQGDTSVGMWTVMNGTVAMSYDKRMTTSGSKRYGGSFSGANRDRCSLQAFMEKVEAHGGGTRKAQVRIGELPGDQYSIAVDAPSESLLVRVSERWQRPRWEIIGETCRTNSPDTGSRAREEPMEAVGLDVISGKRDPQNRDVLKGSISKREDDTRTTITWDLKRD